MTVKVAIPSNGSDFEAKDHFFAFDKMPASIPNLSSVI